MSYRISLAISEKSNQKITNSTITYIVSEKLYEEVKKKLEAQIPLNQSIAASIEEENSNLTGKFARPNKDTLEAVQELLKEEAKSPPVVKGKKYLYDEKVILNLIYDGRSDSEIARLLKIPYQTLHHYIKKKGYRNRDSLTN